MQWVDRSEEEHHRQRSETFPDGNESDQNEHDESSNNEQHPMPEEVEESGRVTEPEEEEKEAEEEENSSETTDHVDVHLPTSAHRGDALGHAHYHPEDDEESLDYDDYEEKKYYFLVVFVGAALALVALLISASLPEWAFLPLSSFFPAFDKISSNRTLLDILNETKLNISNHSEWTSTPQAWRLDTVTPAMVAATLPTDLQEQFFPLLSSDFYHQTLTRSGTRNVTTNLEYRMWGFCECYNTGSGEPCETIRGTFFWMQLISCVSVGIEFCCVLCASCIYAGFFRLHHRLLQVLSCVLMCVVCFCLLASIMIISIVTSRKHCSENFQKRGNFGWSFAIRCVEWVTALILAVLMIYQARKRTKRGTKTLLFGGFMVFSLTCLTTTSRSWIVAGGKGFEMSLWQGCMCAPWRCNTETGYFQGVQAMCIMGCVALCFFVICYFLHIRKWIQIVLLSLTLLCLAGMMVLLSVWYRTGDTCADVQSEEEAPLEDIGIVSTKQSPHSSGVVLKWVAFVPIGSFFLVAVVVAAVGARARGYLYPSSGKEMDIDDLLGAPAPKPAPVDLDNMDDLLGGPAPPPPATAAFEDDLLFGGGGGAPAPSAAAAPATDELPQTRPRTSTVAIPALSDPPVGLAPFCTENTFFARFVSMIDQDEKRTRKVLTVTEASLNQFSESNGAEPERTVPVQNIIGLLGQDKLVTKRFGTVRTFEGHILIQVEGDRDFFFSLHEDKANGNVAQMLDIVQVVSALCLSYGRSLPFSLLKETEDLVGMVKWTTGDDKVRRQLAEVLAFRTELRVELQKLYRIESTLEGNIAQIRDSDQGTSAAQLTEEMKSIEKNLQEHKERVADLEHQRAVAAEELKGIKKALAEEEDKRQAFVAQTMESAKQDQLLRQVAEYELMKAAHKREMDKIASLSLVLESLLKSRKQQHYAGASAVASRIRSLEDDLVMVNEKLTDQAEHHNKVLKALTEAKKRIAQVKELNETLGKEIATIQETPDNEEVPSHIVPSELPDISPVFLTVPQATRHPTTAAKKGSNNADDDDIDLDDDGDAAPAAKKPAAATPAAGEAVDLDEEDDI